jgi:DHA2 family multidrug resistance protein-like MFS transporter
MTVAYMAALEVPPGLDLPSIVRDSLDEAMRVASTLPDAEESAVMEAARGAFPAAFRAVLAGVAMLWLATGALIVANARAPKLRK